MIIKIKCADCGRELAGFVITETGTKGIEVEVHACYHRKKYGKKKSKEAEWLKK